MDEIQRHHSSNVEIPTYWVTAPVRDLSERRARWANENEHGRTKPQISDWSPQNEQEIGRVYRVDEDGNITHQRDIDRAQGVIRAQSSLLVAEHARIVTLSEELDTENEVITHPWFNDVHSFRLGGSNLLLASTGVDAILEVSPQTAEIEWSWFATENGFTENSYGDNIHTDKEADHRQKIYDTHHNTTHLNSALQIEPSVVIATLFHQGEMIRIDKDSGTFDTLLTGLSEPHGLRSTEDGSISLANTVDGEVLRGNISGKEFNPIMSFKVPTDRLQDCLETEYGWMLVDRQYSRILHTDSNGNILATDQFDTESLLYEVAI